MPRPLWSPPAHHLYCHILTCTTCTAADGFLGVVYLDLYRRPQKFPSAAHFTLRCGRSLPDGSYQVGMPGAGQAR